MLFKLPQLQILELICSGFSNEVLSTYAHNHTDQLPNTAHVNDWLSSSLQEGQVSVVL